MTNREAINLLEEIKVNKAYTEALEMALKALEAEEAWYESHEYPHKEQWIPVTERLPEEKINENTSDFEYVLCATTFGDVRPYKFGQTIGWSEPHFWHWNSMMDKYVVAWCELPEPWKGGEDE